MTNGAAMHRPASLTTNSQRLVRRRSVERAPGWSVCEIVCVMEIPAVFLMTSLLACGQWGAYLLPQVCHWKGARGEEVLERVQSCYTYSRRARGYLLYVFSLPARPFLT